MSRKLQAAILALTLAFSTSNVTFAEVALPGVSKIAASYHPSDPLLEELFRAGITNTMRQSTNTADDTIYVQTGDIPAEWLRDSSAQVRPYLFFAKTDPQVADFLRKVIARQGKCLRIDPYANAFKESYQVWEQKYELDSLCYPIILAWTYWKATADSTIFTEDLGTGFSSALDTMAREQEHAAKSKYTHAELFNKIGRPVAQTGMIWTGFRPSDDACKYNFLIPSEMMAVVALGDLQEIEETIYHDKNNSARAGHIRTEVERGIHKYGTVHREKHGDIYAYEVDGLGGVTLQDDANIPSLLSAPYFGYVRSDDPIYKNTREFSLSSDNPNYHAGTVAKGIGSEHTPKDYIWPLALIMQALTSQSADEKKRLIDQILASDPGDHLLHESFDPNNQKTYTRKDFGWPNALFSELILVDAIKMPPLPVPDR